MLRKTPALVFLTALSVAGLFAQNGDRKGEVQNPLPPDLKVPPAPVRTPQDEAATFTLVPGFHAELIAADPLIGDPIALQFGADGRLWVLEMRGYMPNIDGTNEREPVGVLAVLTDTDGDGRYDKRAEFVTGLVLPRAFSLVGDGVLVGEPTNLWYFRDTDGDGKADAKTLIADEYGNTNNPEHNANGLMWAMDNWIYSANYNGRFRWQGDGKFLRESTISRGQWGITQDDIGRLYYNSNSDPLRYEPVPSAYLKRNAFFSGNGTNTAIPGVPPTLRIWPGRMTPGVNRGYRTLDKDFKLTEVTAACGPVIYRGTMFPEEFRGDAFIADPSVNLVKRIKLDPADGELRGGNAYQGREFMTSTDERFRPVNLFNGPDGALYVVDFYRGIVQHRIYVTSFLRKQIEDRKLDQGLHYGRIWRIVPDGAAKADYRLTLAKASSTELVERLNDGNGWVRDTAQRLLVERRDPAAKAALVKAATDQARPALAREHALWALEGTDELEAATVATALRDRDPRVVAAAVHVGERFIRPGAVDNDVLRQMIALVRERQEPQVRLQLALSLGEAKADAADAALRELAVAAGAQPFIADAIVSGLAGRENNFVETLAREAGAASAAADSIRFATAAILKSGNAKRIDPVLALLTDEKVAPAGRTAVLGGVRLFLPRSSDGRTIAAGLPSEPKPLVALAAMKNAPGAAEAAKLLESIRWPGKPGAASQARPLTTEEQALFEKGKAQFATLCAACHQPNGQGQAGLAPSLVYSRWVLGDPRVLARIVLNGKTQENLVMPPWKAALNDEAIAGVLTFVRRSWGNDANPLTPAIVAEARRDTAERTEPYSDADLQELVQALGPMRRMR